MDAIMIKNKISEIAGCYTQDEISNSDQSLTMSPYSLNAVELAAVFLDIQREFDVDLDKVFEEPINFSVNSIANAVFSQTEEAQKI